jgi:hypothetical protein
MSSLLSSSLDSLWCSEREEGREAGNESETGSTKGRWRVRTVIIRGELKRAI